MNSDDDDRRGGEASSTGDGKGPSRGKELLERLRTEPFNILTEEKLAAHPYVHAAEQGTLTIEQRRAFAQEQYHIQLSDAISFSALAGHTGFVPVSLTDTSIPKAVRNENDLFQFLLGGELYASKLLLQYAQKLGLDENSLKRHQTSALAQAYPSYWSRLALSGNRAAGAVACAVNFPAWGRMCQRLLQALADRTKEYGYADGVDDPALAFVKFFATPIDNLDEMAIAIIEEEQEDISYEDLVEHVRLLQQYEVFFWDAIMGEETA